VEKVVFAGDLLQKVNSHCKKNWQQTFFSFMLIQRMSLVYIHVSDVPAKAGVCKRFRSSYLDK
jgi:hypothetical protein